MQSFLASLHFVHRGMENNAAIILTRLETAFNFGRKIFLLDCPAFQAHELWKEGQV
jgi:hypothetical protein